MSKNKIEPTEPIEPIELKLDFSEIHCKSNRQKNKIHVSLREITEIHFQNY